MLTSTLFAPPLGFSNLLLRKQMWQASASVRVTTVWELEGAKLMMGLQIVIVNSKIKTIFS